MRSLNAIRVKISLHNSPLPAAPSVLVYLTMLFQLKMLQSVQLDGK
jgi:hypothetical protein